tara:strand:+ start:72 stop:332 length:261 start_codon:yes stop_codon:yes gene_type:complete
MKNFIYKMIIASLAIIFIYKFTIGKEIDKVNNQINNFLNADGRKEIINSLKKEIKKANDKENYLDEEERVLIRNFIKKIQKELELN